MNKLTPRAANENGTSVSRALKLIPKILATALLLGQFSTNAVADVAPLSVNGNKVLAGGQPASFAGNSLFWSNNGWGGEKYYNASVVSWLKKDWGSTLIRAAMGVDEGGGYLSDPVGNKNKVKAVVDAAIANDMYVIIDWHTHHAERYQSQSIAFFQEMARTYGNKNHVIYEIYNEPLQVSWSGVIKPYAQAVVNAIRAIDPDNLIIVGTPNWSQDVDAASRDKLSGNNIAYTLHFYAGTHPQWLRDKAQTALNNGAALFVTEWGSVNANGDGGVNYGETNAWVSFMKANNISHANWALNDKAEGSSALTPGASANGGWASSQLTASGAFAKDIIRNWPGNNPGPIDPDPVCTTAAVGSTIQAESWCQMSGVQKESTSDAGGGQNVGWIDAGDWMTYSVDIPSANTYKISYRIASLNGGGQIQVEKAGGSPVYSNINVPPTGGWQNWQTITHNVTLPAGNQLIALSAITGGFNLNWLKIESTTPDSTTPIATLQAENFSAMNGVQTETTSDAGGGLNVGWIDAGDWLSYAGTPVNIPSNGQYVIEYRVASLNGGGSLTFEEAGGSPAYGNLAIQATGGWQNWVTIKHTVTLSAGSRKFGIKANAGGWNLNWIRISKVN